MNTNTATIDEPSPLTTIPAALLSADDSAVLLGISTSHFYELHATNRLGPEPVRMGRSVRWHRDELLAWTKAKCPDRTAWKFRSAN